MSYIEKQNKAFNPITIEANRLVVSSDFHVPYLDEKLFDKLLAMPDETGIKNLAISGDLFDADSYSMFTPMGPVASFTEECEAVRDVFALLLNSYNNIYVCRGNHEARIIKQNFGRFQMRELVEMCIPDEMSKVQFNRRVNVTNEDHLHANIAGHKWMFTHPRNFRIINLSVARDLAARYQCSQIVAHGHQAAMGWDRSGTFRLIDGGGLFDKNKLVYLRETTCYPETKNGFVIIDGTDARMVE